MRALEPRNSFAVINPHDEVRVHVEQFGPVDAGTASAGPVDAGPADAGPADARRTVLLLPTWSLVHSRVWKMQVPFLVQRGYQVIAFDGRGNGLSGRPSKGYATADFVRDLETVLDHLPLRSAVLAGFSAGGRWAIQFAAQHPERVEQLILIAPATFIDGSPRVRLSSFTEAPPDREGWNKYNAVHWREDYRDFVRWFAQQIFTEPHSTKGQDDIVEWAESGTPEMLIETVLDSANPRLGEYWRATSCPTLIVHGSDDAVMPVANSRFLQEARPETRLAVLEGAGHAPHIRDAVKSNLLIAEFLESYAHQPFVARRVHARA
ncbi:MAG TPA: alpha/beta hydrolase [Trueperaceae bacterium]|nr:alpha/beta hydrolase [Trueperaceae bacterium]